MKKATISEVKNNLSRYLRYVREGEPVLVTDRGAPIAEILPRRKTAARNEEHLRRLEAKGIIRRGGATKSGGFSYPPEERKTGVLEALLEERASSR